MGDTTADKVGTTEATGQLLEEICSGVLATKKNAGLYPQNHPVVLRSIAVLQEALGRYLEETGRPFSFQMDAPDLEDDSRPVAGVSVEVTLKCLLRRHLIRTAVLLPEVTPDELFEFCFLLRDDFSKKGQDESSTVHPEEWEHIRVQFYEPEELPDGILTAGTMLEAAAGVRQVKGLQAWMASLPTGTGHRAAEALKKPAFLRELSEIRRMIKDATEGEAPSGGKVDLISEVLSSVMPKQVDESKVDNLLEESLRALKRVAESLQRDRKALLGDVGSLKGSWVQGAQSGKVVEALSSNNRFIREMSRLQGEKQRLAYVFRTSSGEALRAREDVKSETPSPASPAAGEKKADADKPAPGKSEASSKPEKGGPSDAKSKDKPRGKDEGPGEGTFLQAMFKSISYDVKTFRGAIEEPQTEGRELRVLLELLVREEHRDRLHKNWKTILHMITDTGKDPRLLDANLELIVGFVEQHRILEGEDLLSSLLDGVTPATRVVRVLEKMILPRAGVQTARRLLSRIAEGSPEKAVPVLAVATKVEDASLRAAAGSHLVSLAEDPALLVAWAQQDPTCVSRPDVMNVVRKTPASQLLHVFKGAFSSWETQVSTALLSAIEPGVEGMEQVLLAAAIQGPLAVRKVAMRHLPKYQNPAAVDMLTSVVKDNNAREHPCMPEVDAAVEALRSMDDAGARAFLNDVATSRRWLRYTYRKEIRDALSGLALIGKEL